MKAVFVEMPAFARHRADYFDDDGYRELQEAMMNNPEAGAVIEGTGGLRKLRHGDQRRGKGKRGGLQFWLFTLYDKDEMDDLDAKAKRAFRDGLKAQLEKRR